MDRPDDHEIVGATHVGAVKRKRSSLPVSRALSS
jgi:hypothetical protein